MAISICSYADILRYFPTLRLPLPIGSLIKSFARSARDTDDLVDAVP